MDKEEKFQQRIMENGWWIRAATKVMKILCIILVVCMLVSTVSSFFFRQSGFFAMTAPGKRAGGSVTFWRREAREITILHLQGCL